MWELHFYSAHVSELDITSLFLVCQKAKSSFRHKDSTTIIAKLVQNFTIIAIIWILCKIWRGKKASNNAPESSMAGRQVTGKQERSGNSSSSFLYLVLLIIDNWEYRFKIERSFVIRLQVYTYKGHIYKKGQMLLIRFLSGSKKGKREGWHLS